MEEEEDGEMGTPFWVQSTSNVRRVDRFRRGVSSLIFSSGVLLFILLVTAVFFMVFAIPSTIHTAHLKFFMRSNAVMKKWDSVNLVLVLVALFFGFISKNNNRNYNNVVADDIQSTTTTTTSDNNQNYYNYHLPQNNSVSSNVVAQKSAPDTGWYEEYSDRRESGSSSSNYNYYYAAANNNSPRLRRNSTSYPDLHLRQQILSTPSVDYYNVNDQRRYYDDSPVYYRRPSWKQSDASADYDNIQVKNIYVDDNDAVNSKPGGQKLEQTSYVSPPSYPPPPPSPPPPPPPPPRRRATDQKAKRIYESESLPSEYQSNKDVRVVDSEVLQKSSIPPPPPPLPPLQYRVEKSEGSEYKKRNAGKDQNFLTSYYQKKKKKRQRQRSADNLDALFHRSQAPKTHTQPPPPPPPPPPRPSSSVFHNLFSSKKAKRRKIPSDLHLYPSSPPPPPPPPPPQFKAARVSKPKPNIQTPTAYEPPVPIKLKSFSSFDDNSSSGGSSPLHFIRPPPPLPPFKIPEWKHVVKGDYVSIESNPSSRSGSPDTDEADNISPAADPTASPVSLFCPSPDVDTKADNFIARFRAGLKLEKIDSFNKKQVSRMSNLGPGSAPSQD
ncbi:hypothetical protein DCAR_0730309 [Daucus carota subsp. sativus]|uniref:Uncharacterized protein n=1 Tax=Daucus carota subsp. sativus TaxID=79200 RepID=A0A164UT36_DAUCS|nr:PREDICTED: formin-like protein 20 [Daucus carota subsp. sativus]WOH10835.1 hypothetical protein DCAR_0730309 [Daucus carota subsp. sativus]